MMHNSQTITDLLYIAPPTQKYNCSQISQNVISQSFERSPYVTPSKVGWDSGFKNRHGSILSSVF